MQVKMKAKLLLLLSESFKARFHYEREKKHSLFLLLIFLRSL